MLSLIHIFLRIPGSGGHGLQIADHAVIIGLGQFHFQAVGSGVSSFKLFFRFLQLCLGLAQVHLQGVLILVEGVQGILQLVNILAEGFGHCRHLLDRIGISVSGFDYPAVLISLSSGGAS